MTQDPRISVLLPVRDAEATLDACIRSLLRQTEQRWECVFVDDGSRDRSRELIQAYCAQDARLRLIAGPHCGIVAALNLGLEACRGEFVARMDADDWMHRERLALQREALETDPKLAAVGSHVRMHPRPRETHQRESALRKRRTEVVQRRGRIAYERWLNSIETPEAVAREAFVECPIAHPTLFIRRGTLARFGYRSRDWPEDYDLILRLLMEGERLGVVPKRLLGWCDRPGRLSRTDARYGTERFTECKAAALVHSFLAQHFEYILWGYGETGRTLRRALLAYGRAPSQIVELHPGRIGQRIHGARVVSPDELPALPRRPILVSVAGSEPRRLIRAALDKAGFTEVRDFVCVA